MNTNATTMCGQVADELAAIVSGDRVVLTRYADHLATCDVCRDLRHDATRAATSVRDAGDDYEVPVDLERRLLEAVDRGVAAEPVALPVAKSGPVEPVAQARANGNVAKNAATTPATPKAKSSLVWLYASLAAAAVIGAVVLGGLGFAGFMLSGSSHGGPVADHVATPSTDALTARLGVSDDASGVSVRTGAHGTFGVAAANAALSAGSAVRTDDRTRARIALSDGTSVVLNRGTELELDASAPRHVRVLHGEIVADVAHLEHGPHAFFETPMGTVEVLGTKFSLTTAESGASVRVVRGVVRATSIGGGDPIDVAAGQEGVMSKSGGVAVTPVVELAREIAWSNADELGTTGAALSSDDAPIPGLGELRAHLPGERQDRERPLTLASHKVTIRVSGNVARTEIEEVFQNDSAQVLEGSYKFPLPADASIAKLALDIDGRMEQGAFVDRDQAARIWRGVLRHATPHDQRKPNEDYVWVPGPWQDPALLEWQRGGRFELRIYPIPAHGSRRIQIAYTQVLAPEGTDRRYVYPLPHAADASAQVGHFEVDARVMGAAQMKVQGYALHDVAGDPATHELAFSADGFRPSGDLVIDYTSSEPPAELRSWTFQGAVAVPPAAHSREEAPDVVAAQQAYANDTRPFVAFALRPSFPPGRNRTIVTTPSSSTRASR